jgi:hypothetical protein
MISRIALKNGLIIQEMEEAPGYYVIFDPGTPNRATHLHSIRECLEFVEWLLAIRLFPDQWESITYRDVQHERVHSLA